MNKLFPAFVIIILLGLLSQVPERNVVGFPGMNFMRKGKASWYSRNDPGINPYTASNERFDDNALTCAMWGVQFHRRVKVTNMANGRSVVLRVNDRGPHERYIREGRIIDLTKRAFSILSPNEEGLIEVMVQFL